VALSILTINIFLLSVIRNRFLQISYFVLFVSFLLSNLLYYRYFEIQIKLGQLLAIGNLPLVTGYAVSLLRKGDIVIALGLVSLILLSLNKAVTRASIPKKTLLISIILLSVLRVGVHIPAIAFASGYEFVRVLGGFVHSDNHIFTLRFGFSVGLLSDLFNMASNSRSEDKLDGVKEYRMKLAASGDPAPETRPNIIILQLESIDFQLLGLRQGGVEITPFMNRMMKEALFFPNYYTVRYTGSTSDAEFSILTSLHPLTDKPSFYASGFERIPSLPTVLAMHSYTTAAFHANKASFWGRINAFKPLGIETYHSLKDYSDLPRSKSGTVPDKYFLRRTLDIISAMPEPIYAHVLTISSHGPFKNIEFDMVEDLPRDMETNDNKLLDNYFRIARHLDSLLGEFVRKTRERFGDYIIVIVGDHTAGINQDTYVSRERGPGKVPFFIITNRSGQHGPIVTFGNHLDIAPTLAGLANIPSPRAWQGSDLLSPDLKRERLYFKQPLGYIDHEARFNPISGRMPETLNMAEKYLWH